MGARCKPGIGVTRCITTYLYDDGAMTERNRAVLKKAVSATLELAGAAIIGG